jgi:hypothetical protein
MMQVKLSVLKEEKRLLMLKLKQRELQLQREEADQVEDSENDYETESEMEEAAGLTKKNFFQIVKQKKRSRSESPFAR